MPFGLTAKRRGAVTPSPNKKALQHMLKGFFLINNFKRKLVSLFL